MNKFYMSLDEVGKNEFYIACLYLVKDIIRDVEKREGFNMDRNNYHLLTDDETMAFPTKFLLPENCTYAVLECFLVFSSKTEKSVDILR